MPRPNETKQVPEVWESFVWAKHFPRSEQQIADNYWKTWGENEKTNKQSTFPPDRSLNISGEKNIRTNKMSQSESRSYLQSTHIELEYFQDLWNEKAKEGEWDFVRLAEFKLRSGIASSNKPK